MIDRELMQQAFERITGVADAWTNPALMQARNGFIQGWEAARLAQPEPEPVAWMHDQKVGFNVPLYTAPPQREWQGLTDEDVKDIVFVERSWADAVRKVEAKLKEKNT